MYICLPHGQFLDLLTDRRLNFLTAILLARQIIGKLFKYMRLSSPSDRQRVPKAWAFIVLLGLLLIATFAFAPNSSAGLPAFQNGGGSGAKRSRPEFVPGEALVRFKSGRAFEGSIYMPVPSEGAAQKFGNAQSAVGPEEILVQVDRFAGSDILC